MLNKKNYLIFFLTLLIVTFLYGKLQGGFVSWFLFYTTLALSIYIWMVAKFSLQNLRITRTLSKDRLTSGDHLEVN